MLELQLRAAVTRSESLGAGVIEAKRTRERCSQVAGKRDAHQRGYT
jgi:hypothetical protein